MRSAARVLLHVPVFGWFLKDAIYGLPDAKFYFIGNLAFAFAVLTYVFGYPFVIICALTATATALVLLLLLTASDLLANKKTRPAPPARARG